MNGSDQFELGSKLATITTEIAAMKKSLDDMKTGMWRRLEIVETIQKEKIPVLENQVNDIRRFLWMGIAGIGLQLIAGIAYLIQHRQ